MTLKNVWRSLKISALATALMAGGTLLFTTGCHDKCDTCSRHVEKPCDTCSGARVETHKEAK